MPTQASMQPKLVITAQQSRFWLDATDAPTSKDIVIKDLNIGIGNRELLNHANVTLLEKGRYVLVGRNGEGKSSLLRALADRQIPGVALNIRILLLGQTRELSLEETVGGLSVGDETVLQHVLRSDSTREIYIAEERILSQAMDFTETNPAAPITAFRKISHQRLEKKLDEVKRIATRRSGARGWDARKVLIKVEEEVQQSQQRLEEDLSTMDPSVVSAETKAAVDMLADIQAALEMMDAAAAESRARTVLLGLGFKEPQFDAPMTHLSGGWRTRCDLACSLCTPCDVLLLDEPTNFLDLPAIIWLQAYISESATLADTTVVTVTHDRDFADAVAKELLILRHGQIEVFKGNLSTYEREKFKKIKWLRGMKESQEKQKKSMEDSIKSTIRAAKKSGDDKKLKQAASRQRKADERIGMMVSAKGTRFKLNRDRVGKYVNTFQDIEVPEFDLPPKIKFPSLPPELRFPGALVSLENVSFSYTKKGPATLSGINFTVHYGHRYGFAGLNGSGKSTLINLMTGENAPTTGTVTRHPRVKIARFNQHVVEDLDALARTKPELTALAHLKDVSNNTLSEQEARGLLAGLGLQGSYASDVSIAALSGGQKVRLAFAILVWSPPHLLVLDEVTTHLDSETIIALIEALKEYEGAVVVVTHDRFFMRCVVEGEEVSKVTSRAALEAMIEAEEESQDSDYEEALDVRKGTVYRVFKGSIKPLERGMEEYEDIASKRAERMLREMT